MSKKDHETWTIQFEGLNDDEHGRPVPVRIRALVKYALRSLRLRCLDYSTTDRLDAPGQPATEQAHEDERPAT